MPAWCSSRTSSPGWSSDPIRAPRPRRNACAPAASTTTSTMSATPRATTPSSRCSAISRSATISRSARSSSPGTCSPRISASLPTTPPGHRLSHRRRGGRLLEEDRRPAGRAHHPHRDQRQFLGDGRHRPLRPVLGDLLRPRRGHSRRPARQPRRGRRPLHRDLEPRLHAVRAGDEGGAHRPAAALDRHRHGAGAHRRGAAGRARQLRHRPVQGADPRLGRGDRRPRRGQEPGEPPHHRRPSARLELPDRRRRAAVQRGPRLCAAPHHAPRHAPCAAAGRGASR